MKPANNKRYNFRDRSCINRRVVRERRPNWPSWNVQGKRSQRSGRSNVQINEPMNEGRNFSETNDNQEQSSRMETGQSSMNGANTIPETNQPDISKLLPSTATGAFSCQSKEKNSKKTILAWLTNCQLIEEGELVQYKGGKKLLTGRISNGGILCSCCDEEVSIWNFEKHAQSFHKQPYKNIYLIRPQSTCLLHDCLVGAWNNVEEQKRRRMLYVPKNNNDRDEDKNRDACLLCGDGEEVGEFISCNKCPAAYHRSCINMQRTSFKYLPCPYCICKYCAAGDEAYQLVTCCQCRKKFHWECVKDTLKQIDSLQCSASCKEIYEKLKGLVGIENIITENESYSWRLVQQMDTISDDLYINNHSKLAIASMLMNEAFGTITDTHHGINVVQSVIYNCGSNLPRLDFRRFHTLLMEKDDEVIAAASIRFHGSAIAEMPFIATNEAYEDEGIFQLLMGIIESFLESLKVKKWIISSSPQFVEIWKNKFNFDVVANKDLKREISSYNMLMFCGSIRLHKNVYRLDLNVGPDQES